MCKFLAVPQQYIACHKYVCSPVLLFNFCVVWSWHIGWCYQDYIKSYFYQLFRVVNQEFSFFGSLLMWILSLWWNSIDTGCFADTAEIHMVLSWRWIWQYCAIAQKQDLHYNLTLNIIILNCRLMEPVANFI